MKERVERLLGALDRRGIVVLHEQNARTIGVDELRELIKDLWQESQTLKASIEGMHGAIAINELVFEDLEENQRIAIEAMQKSKDFLEWFQAASSPIILGNQTWNAVSDLIKLQEQALSTIRGK